MHEDPTRMMGEPPDDGRPHGNMRLVVAGLIAVIVGLLIAVIVIANDDGGSEPTTSIPSEATSLPSTETTEPETTTDTTETTEPTTGETTTTTETTTSPTTPEEGGSGGIEAP